MSIYLDKSTKGTKHRGRHDIYRMDITISGKRIRCRSKDYQFLERLQFRLQGRIDPTPDGMGCAEATANIGFQSSCIDCPYPQCLSDVDGRRAQWYMAAAVRPWPYWKWYYYTHRERINANRRKRKESTDV